jgi:glycosyltransferase involved in cell wall biosynthesis
MFGGSGTNIKMLEFMAAGLPIVSTPIGARGLDVAEDSVVLAEAAGFARALAEIASAPADAEGRRQALRAVAERRFSWERISSDLGTLLKRRREGVGRPKPYFSVIVPTYDRPKSLSRLVQLLAAQTWRDFEVIVIDQSDAPWPDREREFGLDLYYVHTDLRGAVYARNRGADLATGRVLAFIDDDCEPCARWLEAAQTQFSTEDIVGLEGLISSGPVRDKDLRSVTNVGFEGIGFMTANLFVRAEVFHQIDGFDLAFDHPHFREDTDLGWRLQQAGPVPYCREAAVYHPPQSRKLERESVAERSKFFEKDALLFRKHPKKYVELFWRECQWTHNPLFWKYLIRGARRRRISLPPEIRSVAPKEAWLE